MPSDIKEIISRIFDRAQDDVLAALTAQPASEIPQECLPEWMTTTELARYWRMTNEEGEPVTAGIISWANRPPDSHPLPCARMGEVRRFHREEADKWAWEEAELRRAKQARLSPAKSVKSKARSPQFPN
jgi:hypothetical protein